MHNKGTEVSHFWVGYFDSEEDYSEFIGEDNGFYNDDRDIEEKFISKFAESQGENWIDHDFMECGFENSDEPLSVRFKKYSYSEKWLPELERRIEWSNIDKLNSIVFVTKKEIAKPVSVSRDNFTLLYAGEIEYEI